MKGKKTLSAIFACIIALAILIPAYTFAEEGEKTEDGLCSVTVKTDVAGMKFTLYTLASLQDGKRITLEEFADFSDELDEIYVSEKREALAEQINNFIKENSIAGESAKEADENGVVLFNGIPQGVYLILSSRMTDDEITYYVSPFIVSVPDNSPESGEKTYDVTAFPKVKKEAVHKDDTCSYTVVKIWDDAGKKVVRPESITAQLRQDAKVYSTVVLSEENNWTYSWDCLPAGYEWTVTESEVVGYKGTVVLKGSTFVITNTPTGKGAADTSTSGTTSGKLPQTGLLWWPVPILLAAGLLFIAVGLIIRIKKHYE